MCPKCSEAVPEGATHCPHDGTQIPTEIVDARGHTMAFPGSGAAPDTSQYSTPEPIVSSAGSAAPELEQYLEEEGELAPGSMAGEYKITAKIGEGGMGMVYAAVHPIIGKRVAVKVLAQHVASNREVVRRFVAEARAVNKIGHRNIVDVFSFGQLEDGREFYVMELLKGESLEELLEKTPTLPATEVIELFTPILDALQAAHNAQIVHRDLKPDNIFIVEDSRGRDIKILDFGIAKLTGEDEGMTRTRTGVAMGTPDYMSPEQCRGAKVDHRTDIYALGVILYRLLTGRFPYQGASAIDLLYKQMHEEPPTPSSISKIGAEMEKVVLKCLEKAADDRYSTPEELGKALREAFEEPGEELSPDGTETAAISAEDSPDDSPKLDSEPKPSSIEAEKAAQPVSLTKLGEEVEEEQATSAPTSTNRLPVLILVGAVAIGGGAAALVLTRDKTPPPVQPIPVATAEVSDAAVEIAEVTPPPPDAAPALIQEEPQKGTLVIKTGLKGATIKIDGEVVGKTGPTGLFPTDQPAGEYTVEVSKKGYKPESRLLMVEAGKKTPKVFKLKKLRRKQPEPPDEKPLDNKEDTLGVEHLLKKKKNK